VGPTVSGRCGEKKLLPPDGTRTPIPHRPAYSVFTTLPELSRMNERVNGGDVNINVVCCEYSSGMAPAASPT
jgi:hypothetical protein